MKNIHDILYRASLSDGNIITVTHSSGFFSCCSIRLHNIVNYHKHTGTLPEGVDSRQQFKLYNPHWTGNTKRDIAFDYFDDYDNAEDISGGHSNYMFSDQWKTYSSLPDNYFTAVNPYMRKYFKPTSDITTLIHEIDNHYKIKEITDSYNNLCTLLHRGNDKAKETPIPKYTDYISHAKRVMKLNPDVRFLLQSDETEFIETLSNEFPDNSFHLKDHIRTINSHCTSVDLKDTTVYDNYKFSKLYLAITLMMSKSKYIICGTGNCSIWVMLYRGHANNVIQFDRAGEWISSI